jgi:hypothetical protein
MGYPQYVDSFKSVIIILIVLGIQLGATRTRYMLYMYLLYHTNNVCLSSSGHLTFLASQITRAGKKGRLLVFLPVQSPESRVEKLSLN